MTDILNFIIIFLLVTAIVYGFMLNRRINLIRDSRKELAILFKSFDETIYRAQKSVEDIKGSGQEIAAELQAKVDKAAILLQDLEFLHDRAANTADRLEKTVNNTRNINAPKGFDNSGDKIFTQKNPLPAQEKRGSKSLEALIEEISEASEMRKKEHISQPEQKISAAKSTTAAPKDGNEKKKMSIASALKTLGYGE